MELSRAPRGAEGRMGDEEDGLPRSDMLALAVDQKRAGVGPLIPVTGPGRADAFLVRGTNLVLSQSMLQQMGVDLGPARVPPAPPVAQGPPAPLSALNRRPELSSPPPPPPRRRCLLRTLRDSVVGLFSSRKSDGMMEEKGEESERRAGGGGGERELEEDEEEEVPDGEEGEQEEDCDGVAKSRLGPPTEGVRPRQRRQVTPCGPLQEASSAKRRSRQPAPQIGATTSPQITDATEPLRLEAYAPPPPTRGEPVYAPVLEDVRGPHGEIVTAARDLESHEDLCYATRPLPTAPVMALLRARETGALRARRPGAMSALGRPFVPRHCTSQVPLQARVFCGKFNRRGDLFCAATQNSRLYLFDARTWERRKTVDLSAVGWSVVDVDFSPDQRFVAYSTWSDVVQLQRLDTEADVHENVQLRHQTPCCMFSIRFSGSGRELLAGSNSCVLLADLETRQRTVLPDFDNDVNSVCFMDSSGNVFAAAGDDMMVRVYDRRTLRPGRASAFGPTSSGSSVGGFVGHLQGITCLAPRGDGRFLLTNSKDQSMKIWDLRNMNGPAALRDLALRNHAAQSAAAREFDYRLHRFVRSGRRMEADRSVMTFLGHSVQQTLIRCDFSPLASTGAQYVYTGSADGSVHIFDALTAETVHVLAGHTELVRDVSWHPSRPTLVSSSWDATLRRWDVGGGDAPAV